MKYISTLTLLLIVCMTGWSQSTYYTKAGYVKFFSSTPVENIEAENQKLTVVLDTEKGKLEFAALMKSFEFEKPLMEEHFNENYVESNTYPKATFKGQIKDYTSIDKSSGDVTVVGTMKMHGVEKEITAKGTLKETASGQYQLDSKFMINPEDYDIEIPNTVRDNIAENVEVTVKATLDPLKK